MVFSRVTSLVGGVVSSFGAAYFVIHKQPVRAGGVGSESTFTFSTTKWDYEWDLYGDLPQDISGVVEKLDTVNDIGSTEIEKKKRKSKSKPVRFIVLVRHGIYSLGDGNYEGDAGLTPLGREQARLAGKRLRDMGYVFNSVTSSTMKRAIETRDIILAELDQKYNYKEDSTLNEGRPYIIEPPSSLIQFNGEAMEDLIKSHSRIESAFRRYFRRPDPALCETDTVELIIGHANVFRYLF